MAVAEGVLSGVAVWGGITAADVSTREAEPEVHPRRADAEALLATLGRAWAYGLDEAEMGIGQENHAVSSRSGAAPDKHLRLSQDGLSPEP